jgi:hypothetical protein
MKHTKTELRPCVVNEKKALFHGWYRYADVFAPSPMIGGAPGGQYERPIAIVEYEDGKVGQCSPADVQFCDPPHSDYTFDSEKQEKAEIVKTRKNSDFNTESIRCPFCAEENKNAIIIENKKNKEYFVYCRHCGIETIESYASKASAVKSFSQGKNQEITDLDSET